MPEESPWGVVDVTVTQSPAGGGDQPPVRFAAQSLSFTWSWGSSPASAALTFVSSADYPQVLGGQWVQWTMFGRTFWGRTVGGPVPVAPGMALPTSRSSGGHQMRLDVVDTRYDLQGARVFCVFNKEEVKIVNGERTKRYWHILPVNARQRHKTYTTTAYTAAQVLDFILKFNTFNFPGQGTIGYVWETVYHADQFALPVYDLDFETGRRLDEALLEISEAQGLLFTVMGGPYRLVWARKGEGVAPVFPAASDDQQVTRVLSGNPTRMYLVGDRNLYMVTNVALRPDWNRNWEGFIDELAWQAEVYFHFKDPTSGQPYYAIPGDTQKKQGWMLATARAMEITVGEYAALRTDLDFKDTRKFQGRSRMQMPVALYVNQLVFRAFRPPQYVNINGAQVPTESLDIVDKMVVAVEHDPKTGAMAVKRDDQGRLAEIRDGNGYAIAQGYNVGSELFQKVNPTRFKLDDWLEGQNLWQHVPFQADQSDEDGKFVIFDQPMLRTTDWVLTTVDPGTGITIAYLNTAATFTVPEVRAAVTFEGDRFVWIEGTGSRDDQVNVNGLHGEYVVQNGVATEVPYADGKTAGQKAAEILGPLLQRPYFYDKGSFKWRLRPGDVIPDLNGTINRITVDYSASGYDCTIELTNERNPRPYVRERDLDRATRQNSLLSGQAELKDAAHQLKLEAAALKQSPKLARVLFAAIGSKFGAPDPLAPVLVKDGTGLAPVGTPLWRKSDSDGRVTPPGTVSSTDKILEGVTVRQGENMAWPMRVQKSGEVPVRVLGPVSAGDTLVQVAGQDYLTKSSGESDTAPVAGRALDDCSSGLRLVRMAIGSGSGGAASRPKARWA